MRIVSLRPTSADVEAIENPGDATTKSTSVAVAFYTYPVMQVANILMTRSNMSRVREALEQSA